MFALTGNRWVRLSSPLVFFSTGLLLLPYPGIQNDEALAASPLFQISDAMAHQRLFHHDVPTMLMAYLGALKTWIYAPILYLFAPTYLTLRLPPLLFGTATVWMLFVLLERLHSRRAAWVGALLLATDTTFLLTTCFDWGPVALQHLLATTGMLLVVLFHQTRRVLMLAAGFFCFGLAFWDKALFAWLFGGLLLATLLVFPNAARSSLSLKNLCAASAALCCGAAPLIAFNVTNHFPTFHAAAGFTTSALPSKLAILGATGEGAVLLGYLTNEDFAALPRQPRNFLERCSFRLRSQTGPHRRNGLIWALLAALAGLPFVWRSCAPRAAAFCLAAMTIAWLQMAVTRGAGAAHHVVLLWPLPMILLGIVFAEFRTALGRAGPAILVLGTGILLLANVLLTNQYLYQFARNGSPGSWTDAIYPLAAGLPRTEASHIALIDWGISQPLDVLDRGKLSMVWSAEPFQTPPPGQPPALPDPNLLNDPRVLWVGHTDGNEQFAGVNRGVDQFAQRAGYLKTIEAIYSDSNGRPVFQTFRLRRAPR